MGERRLAQPLDSRSSPGACSWRSVLSTGGAFEEVLFRGYIFQSLVQGSRSPAALLMAVLFSLAHASNPTSARLTHQCRAGGDVLSVAYFKTRGLWLPIGLHFGWNFAESTLFGLPTSGITFSGQSLVSTVPGGRCGLPVVNLGPKEASSQRLHSCCVPGIFRGRNG